MTLSSTVALSSTGPASAAPGSTSSWLRDGTATARLPESVVLGTSEMAEFARGLAALTAEYGTRTLDDPALLTSVELAARRLPDRLLARLIEFRTAGNRGGTLLIRNLPVDRPLPPTPADSASPPSWRPLGTSTLTQLAVMSVLGEVIAYADEKQGRLVQDICPVPGAENRQENTGSVLLELHTEDGFHPYKPELISLYCLRADHDRAALTVTASIRAVLDQLTAWHRAVLRQPMFRIRFSSSFVGDGPPRYSSNLPVLTGPADDPELCVDFHAMEAVNEDGRHALAALRTAMLWALSGAALQPGDMIIIDNRLAVHGRTGFVPRYDGADRWLRRCFAVADLRRSRGLRGPVSRVCAPVS